MRCRFTNLKRSMFNDNFQRYDFVSQYRLSILGAGVSTVLFLLFYFSEELPSTQSEKFTLSMTHSQFNHEEKLISPNAVMYYNFKVPGNDSKLISFQYFLTSLKNKDEFSKYFTEILRSSKFAAYFWECPPLAKTLLYFPFEFVLTNSPSLAAISNSPEIHAFSEHFVWNPDGRYNSAVFKNLGADATLVSPFPSKDQFTSGQSLATYSHLATFIRQSKSDQVENLLAKVGSTMLTQLEMTSPTHPIWLSTCGTGVYWLHVRLDSNPKYYSFGKYRNENYLKDNDNNVPRVS